jgi:hypothetical protein
MLISVNKCSDLWVLWPIKYIPHISGFPKVLAPRNGY